jgi:hypothetical protein
MLAVLSLSLLTNCASPPDVYVCTELSPSKGWCTWTISEKEFFVDKDHLLDGQTWEQVNATSLRVPAKSWGKLKAFIMKICKKSKRCAANIGTWERKMKAVEMKTANPVGPAAPLQKQIVN